MNLILTLMLAVISFALIALASDRIGRLFVQAKMPLISGFLFTGILAGPYVLGLVSQEVVDTLRFVDDLALGVIAFAAGSELHLKELHSRMKSITWVTVSNAVIVPILGGLAIFWLADWIPFMQALSNTGRVAVAVLVGAILVARSPSSAIAIVNELRARGPFTQTVLGVTMLTDVVIIVLFAIAASTADALLSGLGIEPDFILLLAAELLISLAAGYGIGRVLQLVLAAHVDRQVKAGLVLLIGYGVFWVSALIRDASHTYLPFELLLEPLLICMIGSFVVTNYSRYRDEFLQLLHDIGPPVYIAFFTLTGAGLQLDVFARTWPIALAISVVRLGAIFISSYAGGWLAGDPPHYNRLSWLTFVTQAGVGLGLAKEVAAEFPAWGDAFATLIISAIVVSQLIGPPLFKWAIQRVGEAHLPAPTPEFDGVRDAVIFGLESQSVALARLLRTNGWNVKIATVTSNVADNFAGSDIDIYPIGGFTAEAMRELELERADALVAMLSNDENYQICELAYEQFGIKHMVVRLTQREESDRFARLGAVVFEPTTAMVSLLDHFVRVPAATALLLDREEDQRVIDIQLLNPNLHGFVIRDLRLPLDVLIMSVHRNGTTLVSHGYTPLAVGDWITAVGSVEGLRELTLLFEDWTRHNVLQNSMVENPS